MKTLTTLFCLSILSISFAQTAEEYYATAQSEVEDENYRRSIKSYTKAIELDGKNAQYTFERGRSYFEIGEYLLAKKDLDEAIYLDSTLAKAYHFRALYFFLTENYVGSIDDNDKALTYSKEDALSTACYLNRGEAKYLNKDTLGAYEDLKLGLAKDQDNIESLKVMSNVLHDLGRHEEALLYLNRSIKLEPKEIGAYINKGFELEALGRYEEAVEVYDQAEKIDSKEPLVLSNRAHAYYKLSLYDNALKDANRSIMNQSMNPYAYRTRAMIYIALDENEKACKDLKTAQAMGYGNEVKELQAANCR